jgi:UDP-N-acetylglucosamine transferase subunit ALG13
VVSRVPRVAVLLGTDHHPFDRLVSWVAELTDSHEATWFVQHGHTRLPRGLDGSQMLTTAGLTTLLDNADAVVTHGGPGLIMEARDAGHLPIVVPRDPRLHEHVDDHQLRFASYIGDCGLAMVAHTLPELRLALVSALARGRAPDGLPSTGVDPSEAFGALVADVLHSSMSRGPGRETR